MPAAVTTDAAGRRTAISSASGPKAKMKKTWLATADAASAKPQTQGPSATQSDQSAGGGDRSSSPGEAVSGAVSFGYLRHGAGKEDVEQVEGREHGDQDGPARDRERRQRGWRGGRGVDRQARSDQPRGLGDEPAPQTIAPAVSDRGAAGE